MMTDSPKILLVEDEPDVCSAIHSFLGKRGCIVSTTTNGKEALSLIEISRPDIILLDFRLHDLNGQEVLRILRQKDKVTKVIVITGEFLPQEEIDNVQHLGVSAYLHKPILLEQLEEIINKILENKMILKTTVSHSQGSISVDVSGKAVAHELSNLFGIIRNKCENFILDREEGIHKGKTDQQLIEMSVEIMKLVINTIDRATQTLDKNSGFLKKLK